MSRCPKTCPERVPDTTCNEVRRPFIRTYQRAWNIIKITAEELDAEFDRLQLTPSNPQNLNQQQVRPLPGRAPQTDAKLHDVYNLDETGAITGYTTTCEGGTMNHFMIGSSNLGLEA